MLYQSVSGIIVPIKLQINVRFVSCTYDEKKNDDMITLYVLMMTTD